jgi:Protein of unknown function (DUF1553)/Protein of unknown function (DUF1549)/Planctomycete cytochrome C
MMILTRLASLVQRKIRGRVGVALASWAVLILCAGSDPSAKPLEFNRDIRPILSEHCFACHGPDKNHRKADLRLDVRESALDAEVIVPGKPAESALVDRINSVDPTEIMPPPRVGKPLDAAKKAILRRWIEAGAEYQPHWAYVPPKRPELPSVKRREWVRNPIDAFILGTLESRGIAPSREADRRTLLRRLSLDLTGLPPTTAEIQAFVEDNDPNAYEKQVDRLLASPHFGERMAVSWLDLARFTDTVGYHGDQNQNIFPYRDYVIDAFNRNKPFDRFTVEQLAGDLLPTPTTQALVATGFNRLNMVTREGGAQPKEYLAKYTADRVRTVATTWLGSTLGCAECHDHKYDPFTSRDFYRLGAFFADVKQWGVYQDYGYTPNPDLKGWSNDHPFPPEIEVASPYLLRRIERLRRQIERVVAGSAARRAEDVEQRKDFEVWQKATRDFLEREPSGWVTPLLPAVPDVAGQEDGSLLLSGTVKKSDHTFQLKPRPGWVAAIRLELLPHAKYGDAILRNSAAGTLIRLSAAVKSAKPGRDRPLAFAHAEADFKDDRYANGFALIGVKEGWKTSSRHRTSRQAAVWLLDRPIQLTEGDELDVTVRGDNLGCIRISLSPLAGEDARESDLPGRLAKALKSSPATRTTEEVALVQSSYLMSTGSDAVAFAEFQGLRRRVLECRDGRATTLITQARDPITTRVLPRGNWLDESGEPLTPGVPGFLPQPSSPVGSRLNRLDLARWLTAPENPLTARVFVNRVWKGFFGAGISGSTEDLGAQGESPVHPELLDWLAVEFRTGGWDIKRMIRLMVTSSAYRQDSRLRPELHDIDPNNRLLASQSPRRLDAEFVRDNALAIAGLLDPEIGGPSVHPYQPEGYYANLQFPDRRYIPEPDDRQYRRGVYIHWQRTFLHPMLANFDAPSREDCTATRTVANTPQQALTLLNDPTFVEAARVLAGLLLLSAAHDDATRIDLLYLKALGRPARANEKQSLIEFLGTQRSLYRDKPEDAKALNQIGQMPAPKGLNAAELAAWTSVCRVVLNLHETITRY